MYEQLGVLMPGAGAGEKLCVGVDRRGVCSLDVPEGAAGTEGGDCDQRRRTTTRKGSLHDLEKLIDG